MNEAGCSGPQKDLTGRETSIQMGRREGGLDEETDVWVDTTDAVTEADDVRVVFGDLGCSHDGELARRAAE